MPKAKTSGAVSLPGGPLLVLVGLLWGANAVSIKISNQGIPPLARSAVLMPVIPFLGDDEVHLEHVVRTTKDHGGSFVLAGGLTMDGIQAERTLEAARRFDPAMESRLRELYNWPVGEKPSYALPCAYTAQLGLTEFGHRTISQILE